MEPEPEPRVVAISGYPDRRAGSDSTDVDQKLGRGLPNNEGRGVDGC